MPEMNTTDNQSQRNDVDNANYDSPTQAGEGQIQPDAQTCVYFEFLHN